MTENSTNQRQEPFSRGASQQTGGHSPKFQDRHSQEEQGCGDAMDEICPATRHVRRTYEMWLRAQRESS